MTWEEILRLYRTAAGSRQEAIDEQFDHVNFAYRQLASEIDVRELYQPDFRFTVPAGQDFFDLEDEVFSVHMLRNVEDGRKLDPEPGGMRGRARYLEDDEATPPLGTIAFYAIQGPRIWFRDTPKEDTRLQMAYRWQPEKLTKSSTLTEHPITPRQFDQVILWRALASFFQAHPPMSSDGVADYSRANYYETKAASVLATMRQPKAEENMDRRQWTVQAGYDFSVSGR